MLDYCMVEVICIFRVLEWKIFRLNCETIITKDMILQKLFDKLTREEIQDLLKLSLCQLIENEIHYNESEILPFITECAGRLCFEPLDIDNLRIREQYLS